MAKYIGWQGKFPAFVSDSREELEHMPAVRLDRITKEDDGVLLDDKVVIGAEAVAAAVKKRAADSVRRERDRRLAESDYMLMPDYPLDQKKKEAVTRYRQQLRDIPEQQGFPWSDGAVPWPELSALSLPRSGVKACA